MTEKTREVEAKLAEVEKERDSLKAEVKEASEEIQALIQGGNTGLMNLLARRKENDRG